MENEKVSLLRATVLAVSAFGCLLSLVAVLGNIFSGKGIGVLISLGFLIGFLSFVIGSQRKPKPP
jgi:hypothetical protein